MLMQGFCNMDKIFCGTNAKRANHHFYKLKHNSPIKIVFIKNNVGNLVLYQRHLVCIINQYSLEEVRSSAL